MEGESGDAVEPSGGRPCSAALRPHLGCSSAAPPPQVSLSGLLSPYLAARAIMRAVDSPSVMEGARSLTPGVAAPYLSRDMGRYGEIWGDVGRYGEI